MQVTSILIGKPLTTCWRRSFVREGHSRDSRTEHSNLFLLHGRIKLKPSPSTRNLKYKRRRIE